MGTITIGDSCEVLNGYAFKSEKYTSSGIRVIRIANVQKGYIEDDSPVFYQTDDVDLNKYMLRENDLLVSLTGNVGRTALLTKDMLPAALNQRVACLRLKTNKITRGFLFHLLNSDYFESKCIQSSQGVAQKNLSTEWLKSYDLPLYSLSKQNEITKILDNVRNTTILKEQEIQKYDELIKARFVEMFGTLDDPADEFEKATLKKLCNKITDGKHGGCTSEEGTQRYFVGAREIYDDEVHYDTAPEINVEEFEKDYKRCNIEIGDFLIVNTGATIGKSAIAYDERTEHTLLQKSVALLKIKKDKLNPVFLKWCYRVNTRMYMVQSASAQPNLLLSKINGTVIYVPSIERQNQFADFVQQVDKSRFDIKKSIIELEREVVYD